MNYRITESGLCAYADTRPTYQEYRAGIFVGGRTTMTDQQRAKARRKRKAKSN